MGKGAFQTTRRSDRREERRKEEELDRKLRPQCTYERVSARELGSPRTRISGSYTGQEWPGFRTYHSSHPAPTLPCSFIGSVINLGRD